MSLDRPRLRPLELVAQGHGDAAQMVLRDRSGLTPPVPMPPGAVLLVSLMDGRHTLPEIQREYSQLAGVWQPLGELEQLVQRLDTAFLLEGERFDEFRRPDVQAYLRAPRRLPTGAGVDYPADPHELRRALDVSLSGGAPRRITASSAPPAGSLIENTAPRLRGLVSPASSIAAAGEAYGAAFRRFAEESDAELFVVLGACRRPMREMFCVLSKDFETPLGRTSVDRGWIDAFAGHYATLRCAPREPLFHDVLAHRTETAIEIQTVYLQHLLAGSRPFQIVPILLGDLRPPEARRQGSGELAPITAARDVQAFITAMRVTEAGSARRACYLLAADLAERDWSRERVARERAARSSEGRPMGETNHFASSSSSLDEPRSGWRDLHLLAALTGAARTERLFGAGGGDDAEARFTAAAFYDDAPVR